MLERNLYTVKFKKPASKAGRSRTTGAETDAFFGNRGESYRTVGARTFNQAHSAGEMIARRDRLGAVEAVILNGTVQLAG